jgi:hypothetical protein
MATIINGHRNYNAWNVSLWLNSDEELYRAMQHYTEHHNRKDAATKMFNMLRCQQGTTKPKQKMGRHIASPTLCLPCEVCKCSSIK